MRSYWPALWTCRRALNRQRPAKLARVAGWLCALVAAAVVSTLDDAGVALDVIVRTLLWLCWCAAAPLAWSLAGGHREEAAIAALVSLAGHTLATSQRAAAGVVALTSRIALPAALVVVVAAVSTQPSVLAALLLVGPFALLCGLALALSAILCCQIAGARGRSLWLAAVVLPWVAAEVMDVPGLSLPGALRTVLGSMASLLSLVFSL